MHTSQELLTQSRAWWRDSAVRYTRLYSIALIALTAFVGVLPHAMGLFEGCAKYVEHDIATLPFLGLAVIGLLNVVFVFVPRIDAKCSGSFQLVLRRFITIVLPLAPACMVVYTAVGAYFPAIVDFPDVLCD